MPHAADYLDLDVWKDEIQVTDTTQDARLGRYITRASRTLDRWCQVVPGFFAAAGETAAARYFDVHGDPLSRADWDAIEAGAYESWLYRGTPSLLLVDPFVQMTSLKTDEDGDGVYEVTWATTDYRLGPANAAAYGEPYRVIEVNRDTGSYVFPIGQRRIEATCRWGWPTVPESIQEATSLLANRLRNRGKTPEGVMGSEERGFISLKEMDPDIKSILVAGRFLELVPF